jgi:hypothetical protein
VGAPTFIAVNQTGTSITLVQLACTVPASGQITLSDFNTTSEIQDDEQLKSLIADGTLLINDGTTTLNQAQSLQYATGVASQNDLSNAVPATRTIGTGIASGLQGGGDLSANRNLSAVFGTGLGTVCQGNDARLSDVRTPTAHATSHALGVGGSDPLTRGTPVSVGTSNQAGTASTFAGSDHVHAHGNQTVATLHAVATTSVNGFMSAADKTKLDGMPAGDAPIAESSTPTTTTSTSDVQMSGMSITLGNGTYLVWFSGDVDNSATQVSVNCSIWKDAAKIAASERTYVVPRFGGSASFCSMAKVVSVLSSVVRGYWSTSGGTATNNRRQLMALRVA